MAFNLTGDQALVRALVTDTGQDATLERGGGILRLIVNHRPADIEKEFAEDIANLNREGGPMVMASADHRIETTPGVFAVGPGDYLTIEGVRYVVHRVRPRRYGTPAVLVRVRLLLQGYAA